MRWPGGRRNGCACRGPKLEERIDWWVERFDPAGRRRPHEQPEKRHADLFPVPGGLAGICAQVRATDGAAIDERLDVLAGTVCPNDPPSKDQRRADALGALAAGLAELRCECDSKGCTAGQRPSGSGVVIHVLAEQGTVEGTGDGPGYLVGHGPLPLLWCRSWPVRRRSRRCRYRIPRHKRSRGIGRRPSWPSLCGRGI